MPNDDEKKQVAIFYFCLQMNETMGGNIGALRAVLKETSAEIAAAHNLSHALVQNQRR